VIESKLNSSTAVPAPAAASSKKKPVADKVLVSTLNFVDLAGSERLAQTNAVGKSAHEGRMINKSLLFLGIVIAKLSEGEKHVPFRDSKLTRILQSSLGGNSRTAVIVCCSPALSNTEHTVSTLRFGTRAVKIRNKAVINEVEGDQALIHRHHTQMEQLRYRLSEMHVPSDSKVRDAGFVRAECGRWSLG
jgi:centromeric protein E